MTVPMVSAAEPAEAKPAVERRPLRELLPTDGLRVLVAGAMLAALVGSLVRFGFDSRGLVGIVFAPTLVLLAAIDARHRVLPNVIVGPAILAVGLILAVTDPGAFLEHLVIAAAAGGFFFAFTAFIPRAFGMGDAKLVFLLGLALGSKVLPALLLGVFAQLPVALYLIAKHGSAARKQTIPFGPFLALGGLVVFFLG